MATQKVIGRPPKVDFKVITRLTDSIQHNSTITEACRYAGISRDTYYRYLNNEVFAEKMATAKDNQDKVVFSFLTVL
jgi:DNA invertase Pin-like site-specific DNA recombinase